mgnify:CR=1 FL=1
MKKWLLIVIAMLFVPYLFRPFALDLHSDIGLHTMQILRLVDAEWIFGFDPNHAYVNPLVQMFTNLHGPVRQAVMFPIFYLLDVIGIPFTEYTINATFVVVGFLLGMWAYYMARAVVGSTKAMWFAVLLSTIPYYVLQMKIGWWHLFTYPLLIGSFAALHRFLVEGATRWYWWFCIAFSAYLTSDPAFMFGGLFLFLYAFVWFLMKEGSVRLAMRALVRMIFGNRATLIPLLVFLGLIGIAIIGRVKFGADFGVFARLLEKQGRLGIPNPALFLQMLVEGMGITGFLLFPAMVVTGAWALIGVVRRTIREPLLVAATLFVWIAFLLIALAGGAAGALYILYVPALFLMVHMLFLMGRRWRLGMLLVITASTYLQTLLYNDGYRPPAFLTRPLAVIGSGEPCRAIWCPWNFDEVKNLGVTTAAFAVRDHLGIQPIPFVSLQENFYVRPKEIFFYSGYEQGPSFSIGRRISYRVEDIAGARVILVAASGFMAEAPSAVAAERNQKVLDFLATHPEYRHVATVTKNGIDMIQIFERDSTRALQIFSVEEYDAKFNEKYGNLRDLGHIDLG